MSYATSEQVKAALRLPSPDAQQTSQITRAIDAATAMIDRHCGRSFALEVASARVFRPRDCELVVVDDISSTTGLVVAEAPSRSASFVTVDAADYQLEPLNGKSGGTYSPYTMIRRISGAKWPTDPYDTALVRVTAAWGWTSVPYEVTEACVLQAVRIVKRPDAPFGVTFGELGSVSVQKGLDPDVAEMLHPYRRLGGIA